MRIALLTMVIAFGAVTFPSGDAQASACKSGWEQSGYLCYPKCKAGFKGAGPVCWQSCPSGFPDHGAFCGKPRPYGRGAGFALWDQGKCQRAHGSCEKWGLIWYPKCRAGFHPAGCCICSPNCPAGMRDIGVSCAKASYGRGAGEALEPVKKAFYVAGQKIKNGFIYIGTKIKEGFEKFGKLIKEKVIDKIKSFAIMLYNKVKAKVAEVIGAVIVSFSSKLGFNEADAKEIVDPKTGMYDPKKLRKVVIRKLLVQYLQPIIKDKLIVLIDKGLALIQIPLDIAVTAIIGSLGSIPIAGGAIAAAVSAAWSFGIKALRSFASKKLSELATQKIIAPLIARGLEEVMKLGKPVRDAVGKLMAGSERIFRLYIRHPSKRGL